MISQANNLRFKNIKVYGGFKAGLLRLPESQTVIHSECRDELPHAVV